MTPSPEELIVAYLDAWELANPDLNPPEITYKAGWFRLHNKGLRPVKWRRDKLEQSTKRLNERAREQSH